MKRRLQSSEPVWHGLCRLAQSELDNLTTLFANPQADTTPSTQGQSQRQTQQVHSLRLAIKRQRALLRLLRPHLDAPRVALENARLREAAHNLAAQRDRVVAMNTLRSLIDDVQPDEQRLLRRYLRALSPTLDTQSSSVHTPSSSTASTTSTTIHPLAAALAVLRESVAALSRMNMPRVDAWSLLETGLQQSYARARHGWRQARCAKWADDDTELYHDWRRDVKRLLYQIEPLMDVSPFMLKKSCRKWRQLGELLGDEHDLRMVEMMLSHESCWAKLPGATLLIPLLHRRRRRLQKRALKLGRRSLTVKPRAFIDALHNDFAHWHQAPQGRARVD